MKSLTLASALALASLVAACGREESPRLASSQVSSVAPRAYQATIPAAAPSALGSHVFAASTPKGRVLFRHALTWRTQQLTSPFRAYFPQKAMCATNLTEVFEEVFGGAYQSANVAEFRKQLAARGAPVTFFLGESGSSLVAKLNGLHAGLRGGPLKGTGYIPVGTVLGGCRASTGRDCLGLASDGHIGMIGDVRVYPVSGSTQVDVVYFVWHNNWLRNRQGVDLTRPLGRDLGTLGDFYLPANYALLGYERHWMPTPFLEVRYDAAGKALAARRLLPELDDLDLGSSEYETFLAVPQEIRAELGAGTGVTVLASGSDEGEPAIPNAPGQAAVKLVGTFLKKRPVQAASLLASEKCEISAGDTVLAYTGRVDVGGGHWKLNLALADRSCPSFSGTVYVFGDHWTFRE